MQTLASNPTGLIKSDASKSDLLQDDTPKEVKTIAESAMSKRINNPETKESKTSFVKALSALRKADEEAEKKEEKEKLL